MPEILFCLGLATILAFEEAGAFMLPGDISIIAAGVHARAEGSPLLLLPLWAAASLAMGVGATFLYRTVRATNRFDRVLPARARDMIQRHGIWGIAVARLLPGLRNATVFAAASSNLPYRDFLKGLIPASIIWSGTLLLLGWFGGATMLAAYSSLHQAHVLRIGSVALILGMLGYVSWRLLMHRAQETPGASARPRPHPKKTASES